MNLVSYSDFNDFNDMNEIKEVPGNAREVKGLRFRFMCEGHAYDRMEFFPNVVFFDGNYEVKTYVVANHVYFETLNRLGDTLWVHHMVTGPGKPGEPWFEIIE